MDQIDKIITEVVAEGYTTEEAKRALYFEGKLDAKNQDTKIAYWVFDDQGSGFGAYNTEDEAKKDIKRFAKFNQIKGWEEKQRIVPCKVVKCPTCQQYDREETIEDYGHCIWCEDHQNE